MKIGILALQGAIQPHVNKLRSLAVEPIEVRNPSDLEGLSGIILPGGESTTMLHVLQLNQLFDPLARFVRERPTLGLCAGLILLAEKVGSPSQKSFQVLPVEVTRNAYGRQIDSFIAPLEPTQLFVQTGAIQAGEKIEGVFIRAPKVTDHAKRTSVLLTYQDEPVMLEFGHLLGATFHPELTASLTIHRYFINKCRIQVSGR
jgi:pyridoxal 5'-phosphate synthase pdxT subunit